MPPSPLLLARLVEVLPASVLILRARGVDESSGAPALELAFVNAAAEKRLALELAVDAPLASIFPEIAAEALAALGAVLRTGELRRLSCAALAAELGDGQLAVVRIDETHVALLFDRPSPTAAQRELDKVASFLESIVENIPAMIFVKDAKTLRFELFNRAAEELLGLSRKDMIGKSDEDFFPSEQVSFFVEQDKTVLRLKELVDIPLEPVDTARGRRWLHTKKIPILDDAGEASHLLGISLDITARHRAEQGLIQARNELEHRVLERTAELSRTVQQLEQEAKERRRAEEALKRSEERLSLAQKMEAIGRLAGGIAHDFNNMLSVILGQVEIALSRFAPSGQLLESLEAIKLAASQSTKLTQQLLAFSRQQVVSPRLVDLNGLLKNLETILRRVIGDDITMVTSLDGVVSLVRVDPGQIEQVVVNLVINARDAMPQGGQLRIATSEIEIDEAYVRHHPDAALGKHVVLSVSDSGTGIDKETQKQIFEPFFTTKEAGRGTGLGLATAYGIVHRSGGSIAVQSELGQGSEFRIYLPAATDQQEQRHSTPPGFALAIHGSETILIVEDQELVRKVTRVSLESFGYNVIVAADGYEALAICQSPAQTIDCVITDIIMPGLTGLALAEKLRRLRPEMPVLYMSGYTDKALIDTSALGPREAFIGKPFTPRALGSQLRELLDRTV